MEVVRPRHKEEVGGAEVLDQTQREAERFPATSRYPLDCSRSCP